MSTTKYALITGATSGIGYELAKLFAKDNYNLIIVSRDQQQLDKTAQELKQNDIDVITISKDLFNRDEVFALCDEVKRTGIQVDVLVNDAGQGVYGFFKDNDIERELKIIDLNIGALTILTKHFLKDMVARNEGKILNLASIASETPGPWQGGLSRYKSLRTIYYRSHKRRSKGHQRYGNRTSTRRYRYRFL